MKENISSPELTLNIWSNDACPVYLKSTFDLWGLAAILSDDRATFPAGPHTFMNRRTL